LSFQRFFRFISIRFFSPKTRILLRLREVIEEYDFQLNEENLKLDIELCPIEDLFCS